MGQNNYSLSFEYSTKVKVSTYIGNLDKNKCDKDVIKKSLS